MKNVDDFIKKKIKEARRRITHVRLASDVLFGLLVGMSFAAILLILSLFIPMYYAPVYAVAAIMLGVICGLLFTLLRRPNMRRAALLLDSKGLKERVITSYEKAGQDDSFSMLLKEDTKRHLTGFSMKEAFPYEISVKQLVICGGLALVIAISGLIDAPARKLARERHSIAMEAKKKAEELAEALEKLEEQDALSEQDLTALKDLLADAKEELKEAQYQEEIEKAKERLEKKLEQMAKELLKKEDQKAAQALMEMAMELNDDLSEEQKNEIKEKMAELNELSEELLEAQKKLEEGELSEEEMKELMAKLAKAAGELSEEELQAALNNAAASMSAEDIEAALAAMKNAQGSQLAAALDMEGTMGMASGMGQGAGEGNGSGEGMNGGSGNGSGTGSGGFGMTGGDGAGGGWYQGSDQGMEHEETYDGDYVSVPEKEQNNENLTGKPIEGESYTQEGGPSVTWDGIRVDYQTVIKDYQKKAYERIEDGSYPADVQDTIKNYFENLNR